MKLISDQSVLTDIRRSWEGVEAVKGRIQTALLSGFAAGGLTIFAADAAHNLPFILSCSVLNLALTRIRDEGHFRCSQYTLGALVDASKNKISWTNHALIREAADGRTDIVHRGKLLRRADCWRYIDAIRVELTAWGIL